MANNILMTGYETVRSDGLSPFDEEILSMLHLGVSRGGARVTHNISSSSSALTYSDHVIVLTSGLRKSFHALEETVRVNAKYPNNPTANSATTNNNVNNNDKRDRDMLWETQSNSFKESCSISLWNELGGLSRSGSSEDYVHLSRNPSVGSLQGYPSSGSLYQRPCRLVDVHGTWERIRTHIGNSSCDGMSFTDGSSYGWDIESIVREDITGILPESFVSDELMKSVNEVDGLLTQKPNLAWDTLQRKLNDLRCDLECVNNGNEDLKEATELANSMRDAKSRPADFEQKWIKIRTAIHNNALNCLEAASLIGNTTSNKSKVAGVSVDSVDSTLFAEELIRSLQNIDAALMQTNNLDWDVLWQALHTLKGDLMCFDNRQGLKQAAQLINNMRGEQRCYNFESQWEKVRALIANEVRTAC